MLETDGPAGERVGLQALDLGRGRLRGLRPVAVSRLPITPVSVRAGGASIVVVACSLWRAV